jgi:hypothetical protein
MRHTSLVHIEHCIGGQSPPGGSSLPLQTSPPLVLPSPPPLELVPPVLPSALLLPTSPVLAEVWLVVVLCDPLSPTVVSGVDVTDVPTLVVMGPVVTLDVDPSALALIDSTGSPPQPTASARAIHPVHERGMMTW